MRVFIPKLTNLTQITQPNYILESELKSIPDGSETKMYCLDMYALWSLPEKGGIYTWKGLVSWRLHGLIQMESNMCKNVLLITKVTSKASM